MIWYPYEQMKTMEPPFEGDRRQGCISVHRREKAD